MRIALDAMGGDFAPQINVEGAIDALCADPDLSVLLVGDADDLRARLARTGYSGERLTIVAAEGFVGMDEKPTEALRRKPRSSIAVCWRLMASHEADGIVSAGNTGGVVAAGLWSRLFLKGVKRPGIAVVLPTLTGRTVLMDVGANPDAKAEHLYQYAVMAQIYSREMLGISQPRVGLMNIGSEDGKGNELVRCTHDLLLNSRYEVGFVGNIEGRGLYLGEADVVICEGFVGNVVLKVSEGMASMMLRRCSDAVLQSLHSEKHLAASAFENLTRRYEYNEVGGAPLLGIDGVCLICHGSSDARSIANALHGATALKKRDVNGQISAALA
ncbi:MAG: phosphate acyltransferase PlsX [Planctomyces sp.]|nr:phosphate acyltransferase PlsX [Planctomyces sp.]